MSIFDYEGTPISQAYDVDGNPISQAYDIDGNEVMTNGVNIMTFNVQRWGGINGNTTIMNNIFNAYQPILFCGVQETGTDGTLNYIPSQFQSGKAMECNVPNKTAILVNTVYSNYSDAAFNRQGVSEARGYQKCYITINGKSVAFFNVHLAPYEKNVRIAQAMELLDMMENETYCIATGDFNFAGTSFTDEEYINLAKPFVDAGYNMANWTSETGLVNTWFSGATVDGSSEKYPCDNIIVSPNITINHIYYDQRKIEAGTGQDLDHIPVIVNVSVN